MYFTQISPTNLNIVQITKILWGFLLICTHVFGRHHYRKGSMLLIVSLKDIPMQIDQTIPYIMLLKEPGASTWVEGLHKLILLESTRFPDTRAEELRDDRPSLASTL